jgi:hypothetical protein
MSEVETEAPPEEEAPLPGGDVDVADLPKTRHRGEKDPPIPLGSWVRLADHEDVPARFVGHIAAVLNSPTEEIDVDHTDNTRTVQKKGALITVKTRDEAGVTLQLPPEAFSEVSPDGRHGVQPIG